MNPDELLELVRLMARLGGTISNMQAQLKQAASEIDKLQEENAELKKVSAEQNEHATV